MLAVDRPCSGTPAVHPIVLAETLEGRSTDLLVVAESLVCQRPFDCCYYPRLSVC